MDAKTGKSLYSDGDVNSSPCKHASSVYEGMFSPDGSKVVTCGGHAANTALDPVNAHCIVWDSVSGTTISTFTDHTGIAMTGLDTHLKTHNSDTYTHALAHRSVVSRRHHHRLR